MPPDVGKTQAVVTSDPSESWVRGIAIDPVRVCCLWDTCQDREHNDNINVLYQTLVECMVCAGQTVFGTCRARWRQILGWNEFVREAHREAREASISGDAGNMNSNSGLSL